MKKVAFKTQSHSSHFHPIASIIILFIGILGTLLVTRVLAQTANTIIYACSQKEDGDLRMVAQGTKCHKDEVAVQWNMQGPQGVPGPSGSGGGSIFCPGCQIGGNSPSIAGKDFSGADLNATQWGNIDISKANFTGAYMNGVSFSKGVTLDSTIFHNVTSDILTFYIDIHGTNTDFSGIHSSSGSTFLQFSNAGVTLTNANFQNAKAIITFDYSSSGTNPDLSNSNFSNADLSGSFQGTTTSFANVNLSNVNFTNANLTGVRDMKTATTTGDTWTGTICPDGTQTGNCVGHFL